MWGGGGSIYGNKHLLIIPPPPPPPYFVSCIAYYFINYINSCSEKVKYAPLILSGLLMLGLHVLLSIGCELNPNLNALFPTLPCPKSFFVFIELKLSQGRAIIYVFIYPSIQGKGKECRRFYACSACRDRQDCSFFQWADEKISAARMKARQEINTASQPQYSHRQYYKRYYTFYFLQVKYDIFLINRETVELWPSFKR